MATTTAPVGSESPADGAGSMPLVVPLGLVLSAGAIHLLATIDHVADSWLRGAFFALAATGQLAAGAWMYRRPDDRRALLAAGITCAAVALVWGISRTTGLPLGVDGGEVQSVGVADGIATLEELALVGLVVAILRRPQDAGHMAWLTSPSTLRIAYAFLSAALAVAALNGHGH